MIEQSTLQNNQEAVEITPQNDQIPEAVQEVMEPKRDELAELKELNFRQMRESAERERRRNEQLEQELAELRRPKQASEPDELDSDDLIEKRQIKKYRDEMRIENERMRKKSEELEKKMEQMAMQSVYHEICATYPDFKQTVSDDSLAQLQRKEPELFEAVMENKNPRSRLVAAYKSIKAHVNTRNYDVQEAKIIENKTKPRAAATVPVQEATTPLATFSEGARWKLSRDEAKALRDDTAKCARNR